MTLYLSFLLPVISAVEFQWSANHNYVWVSDVMIWNDAEDYCVDTFGTHLASIHSASQNTEVANVCSSKVGNNHCFIGLNDKTTESQWVWTDNTALDYGSNWYGGNPGDTGLAAEDCVGILPSSGWGDHFCHIGSTPYTFICNAPNEIFVWSEDNNYIWVGPTTTDWYVANAVCEATFGTQLASIHSTAENTEISNLCDKWAGSLPKPHCFIGLNDINSEGTWEWVDNTTVDYGIPSEWDPPDPNNHVHAGIPEGEDCAIIVYGTSNWGDSTCYGAYYHTSICNAPPSCEVSGDVVHIDWDVIVNDVNDDEIPYYNVTVDVEEDELRVNVDADLAYIGTSCADNGICGFGSTYFISLNSFSSDTLDIFSNNGLNECDNRLASSFIGTSWAEKWSVSETPFIKDHVGSDTYLAYPPSGDYWNLTAFDLNSDSKCDKINYFGSFSWDDLQNNCNNPQSTDSSVEIDVDNDWINLTGTFYINIVSPLYKDVDSGMYRIYELTNEQFTIAVSKSVHVLGSTGISLYKISIIAVNTDEGQFKLDVITETADYLQLTSESLLISPAGYQFNIIPLNNGDCLSFKSNICVQSWQLSTTHNKTCNNFGGNYGMQWTAQCNPNVNNSRCSSQSGDVVTLSVDTDYEDDTCDTEIGKVQFEGQMRFYPNDSFVGNSNNDYLFIVGTDTIYVEIELNYPPNTYSIFDSKLMNVWLCTIDDQTYGSTFSVS